MFREQEGGGRVRERGAKPRRAAGAAAEMWTGGAATSSDGPQPVGARRAARTHTKTVFSGPRSFLYQARSGELSFSYLGGAQSRWKVPDATLLARGRAAGSGGTAAQGESHEGHQNSDAMLRPQPGMHSRASSRPSPGAWPHQWRGSRCLMAIATHCGSSMQPWAWAPSVAAGRAQSQPGRWLPLQLYLQRRDGSGGKDG